MQAPGCFGDVAVEHPSTLRPESWAIVLAGGSGNRMQPFIHRWLGEPRPKQYCVFIGSRTMLAHTLDRAERLVGPERIVLVVGQGHRRYLGQEVAALPPAHVIEQPDDCGTATGVFLALTLIVSRCPTAHVVILPSDHFIFPEHAFMEDVRRALAQVATYPDRLILLGANPDSPNPDYGWILPGDEVTDDGAPVTSFQEKPPPAQAELLFRSGALWNTMIMAVQANSLWRMGQACTPHVLQRFAALLLASTRDHAGRTALVPTAEVLNNVYRNMPIADFSRDIVQAVPSQTRVVPLTNVVWSDWGRPERILATLERVGTDIPEYWRELAVS